MSDNIILEL